MSHLTSPSLNQSFPKDIYYINKLYILYQQVKPPDTLTPTCSQSLLKVRHHAGAKLVIRRH